MFSTTTQIRVRYGETDQMGFLYYGNYALYYEVGRTDMVRALGLNYREMEETGIIMPVVELKSKYIRPALYDDLITVNTILKEWPENHKIIFHSELYNERAELLNIGTTTLVFLEAKTRQKLPMPSLLAEKLKPYFT
ncbi:MAG TPA: thioesterase family protein [Chitinophagaceae bacterium]|jgi:acyl-CoA thioester hydrolase|nr:thioesterase family protein [Chitinophagaceae bacterium]